MVFSFNCIRFPYKNVAMLEIWEQRVFTSCCFSFYHYDSLLDYGAFISPMLWNCLLSYHIVSSNLVKYMLNVSKYKCFKVYILISNVKHFSMCTKLPLKYATYRIGRYFVELKHFSLPQRSIYRERHPTKVKSYRNLKLLSFWLDKKLEYKESRLHK